MPIYNVVPMCS